MLSILLTVWLLHVAALVTPGANVLLVSHLAANGDRRAAIYASVGVTIGAVIWSSAAVLGVSVLFARFPALRLSLQIAGALYLLYVALRMLRAPRQSVNRPALLTRRRALRAGVLTNLSNPKAALFFGSIFSSALPSHPGAALLLAAVGLVLVNALSWHLVLAYVFSRPSVQDAYDRRRSALSRAAAAVVGAIGLSLLAATVSNAKS